MADEARLNEILDIVEQARREGDRDTEARAIAAYKKESAAATPQAAAPPRFDSVPTVFGGSGAPQSVPKAPRTIGQVGLGAAETGAQFATGALAMPLAGIAGGLTTIPEGLGLVKPGTSADVVQRTQSALTYQPTTEAGQDISAVVSKPFQMVAEGGDIIGQRVADATGSPMAGAMTNSLLVNAPTLVGARMAATPKTPRQAAADQFASQPQSAPARTPMEVAESLGLRISPHSAKHTPNSGGSPSRLAQVGDAIAGERSNILNARHNAQQANKIGALEIGLPDDVPLNANAFAQAKKPHIAVYQQVREATNRAMPPDQTYVTDVMSAGRGTESVLPLPKSVETAQQSVLRPMTGGELIDTISDLRQKGYKNINALDNSDANALGNAQLDIANALERQLDRRVKAEAPALSGDYQRARVGFAKIATVENSMEGTTLSVSKLGRIAKKNKGVDGALRALAETGEIFPNEFGIGTRRIQDVSNLQLGSSILGTRHAAAWLTGKTRGEAAMPQVGKEGPLSYYYRDKGPSGIPERGPINDPAGPWGGGARLLPNPKDMPINALAEALGEFDRARRPWGDSRVAPPSVPRLPAPGQALEGGTGYRPTGPMPLTERPFDALSHPGSANAMPEPQQLALADALRQSATQADGIPFENVLIEPVAKRTFPTVAGQRGRGVKQGEAVGPGVEKMKPAPGAKERGMALELALQGKKIPPHMRTALARAIQDLDKKRGN